jgi:FAD/FMN-containing dehydrogenase
MMLSHALSPLAGAATTIACSAGELRRMMCEAPGQATQLAHARLDRILHRDAARALVEVQSGTPWQTLGAGVADSAPALAHCVAQGALAGTVGEAVATNAAAPDGRPLVALVEALTVVTPDGELQRASRAHNAELFALAVGGQDLFGLTYSVTLRLDALTQAAVRYRPPETLVLSDQGDAASRATRVLVPPAHLAEFLGAARALCDEWRAPIARIEVAHSLPEEETMLRWAKQAYAAVTLALELPAPLGACVRGVQLERALIDCAIAFGGSFPIACTRGATRAQVEACYPELRAVLAEKARRDPGARLCNGWYRHHRQLLDDSRVSVRWNSAQAASA